MISLRMAPPVQQKTPSKKELVTLEVRSIEAASRKQMAKINAVRREEDEKAKADRKQIKAELEYLKEADPTKPGWDEKVMEMTDHMKQIVRRKSETQHQLLLKTGEISQNLELKAKPVRRELPTILDFSEEERVHLKLGMDKAIKEIEKKRIEIEGTEDKLQRQMSALLHNTPDPSAPKEDTINKLELAYQIVMEMDDPEFVRSELLANIDASENEHHPSQKTINRKPPRHSSPGIPQESGEKSQSIVRGRGSSQDRPPPTDGNPPPTDGNPPSKLPPK